ncbi:MAG: hypothetical protein H7174_05515, partial [Flavobacterium sp.]|nr:hypothetical protein [Flavobacterium sp.]
NTVIQPANVDSSNIEIADLPIQFNGTKFLIHPIGNYRIFGGKSKYSYGSSNSESGSFKISNYNEYEITGYLSNLKFQEIGTDSIKALTDKAILIQTATYLKAVADKTKQQIIVYTLSDMDTNRDSKLDTNDIKTLYLSTISGDKFTKMSTDFQELIDWELVEASNILYFRTIEDTNKNGQFDKDDVINYNFINLNKKDWKVESYKPV